MNLIPANKILDYLNSSIICMDADLRIRQINATAEVFFDTSEKVLRDSDFPSLFSSRDENSILSSLDFCVKHNHQITEHEAHITLADGRSFNADYSIHPIVDIDSLNLLVELRPMDRHLEIAQEGQRAAQQIASQQLARGMAHEIKNPLGGIRGAAQLLEREITNPSLREYTDVIIREADRLQTLLNNMLGPNRQMTMSRVNIFEVLERVHRLISAEFADSVKLIRDYDPSIPDLLADKDQLVQAFLNIARNAAQAVGEHGNVTFRTRISRQHTIGHKRYRHVVQIDIIDDGPGVSQDVIENIFLPMVSDKADGSGLGLPIAQQIIFGHKGLVYCKSEPGQTIFSILLPLG